jgi:hypothetical protein
VITSILQQLKALPQEVFAESLSAVTFTHCVKEPKNIKYDDTDHFSEEILKSLDGDVKAFVSLDFTGLRK